MKDIWTFQISYTNHEGTRCRSAMLVEAEIIENDISSTTKNFISAAKELMRYIPEKNATLGAFCPGIHTGYIGFQPDKETQFNILNWRNKHNENNREKIGLQDEGTL